MSQTYDYGDVGGTVGLLTEMASAGLTHWPLFYCVGILQPATVQDLFRPGSSVPRERSEVHKVLQGERHKDTASVLILFIAQSSHKSARFKG